MIDIASSSSGPLPTLLSAAATAPSAAAAERAPLPLQRDSAEFSSQALRMLADEQGAETQPGAT